MKLKDLYEKMDDIHKTMVEYCVDSFNLNIDECEVLKVPFIMKLIPDPTLIISCNNNKYDTYIPLSYIKKL